MTPPRLAVIDHGAGNLVSISQALTRCGAGVTIATDPSGLEQVDGVVLPGVGATASVMAGIESAGFGSYLREPQVPLLGICVGMQVLFDVSEEDDAPCLGLLGGRVRRLENAPRLPHIGWNDLDVSVGSPLFEGLSDPVVYFVHSYAPVPADPGVVAATTFYGQELVAAVARDGIFGVQFHPERSGPTGLAILTRFVDVCERQHRAA